MKESHKKRILTKEKQELYDALEKDHVLIRMITDCEKTGLSKAHIIVLVDYVYQLGRDAGIHEGIVLACDRLEKNFIELNKKKSGSLSDTEKPHG